MSRDLTFAEAVRILGSDSEQLRTLDLIFNGAINASAATHRPADVIKVLKSVKLIADHSLALMRRVNEVVKKTKPQRRHEVLVAAHTIVAVSALFEALIEYEPLLDGFEITSEDKRVLFDAANSASNPPATRFRFTWRIRPCLARRRSDPSPSRVRNSRGGTSFSRTASPLSSPAWSPGID